MKQLFERIKAGQHSSQIIAVIAVVALLATGVFASPLLQNGPSEDDINAMVADMQLEDALLAEELPSCCMPDPVLAALMAALEDVEVYVEDRGYMTAAAAFGMVEAAFVEVNPLSTSAERTARATAWANAVTSPHATGGVWQAFWNNANFNDAGTLTAAERTAIRNAINDNPVNVNVTGMDAATLTAIRNAIHNSPPNVITNSLSTAALDQIIAAINANNVTVVGGGAGGFQAGCRAGLNCAHCASGAVRTADGTTGLLPAAQRCVNAGGTMICNHRNANAASSGGNGLLVLGTGNVSTGLVCG